MKNDSIRYGFKISSGFREKASQGYLQPGKFLLHVSHILVRLSTLPKRDHYFCIISGSAFKLHKCASKF